MGEVASPCVKICVIDTLTGWCVGCGRTGAEIGAWVTMSDDEKRLLLAALPARLETMTKRATRGRGR